MKQHYHPEDLAALEEYYRKQLVEMGRKAGSLNFEQPAAQAVQAPAPEIPIKQDVKPQSFVSSQNEKNTETLSAGKIFESSLKKPKPQAIPDLAFSGRREKRTGFPAAGGFGRADEKSILPCASKVLRASPVVPALSEGVNTGIGRIKAHVTTGSGAVPIEGADVIIEQNTQGIKKLIDHLVTDHSGNTPESGPLVTVAASQTLTPGENPAPYAVFQVRIRADGFAEYIVQNVLVFDGEVSLVDAGLLPQREKTAVKEAQNG